MYIFSFSLYVMKLSSIDNNISIPIPELVYGTPTT